MVAVDGPSGSGKSSVSKGVARCLEMQYLDTGAMYRAVTWWAMNAGFAVADIAGHLADCEVVSGTDPDRPTIAVNGRDVSIEIRTPEVTAGVSAVSAVPEVRAFLVGVQRRAAETAPGGLVAEGRDVGTVVFPEAPVKIFLTADVAARAARRHAEEVERGQGAGVSATAESLAARDAADSTRATSPLTPASDAVHVDATYLGLQEVIDQVAAIVRERL